MTTPVTGKMQNTPTEETLFVAFELSEKTWKLGFTTSHGQKPRERHVPARHQKRILDDIAQAKRDELDVRQLVTLLIRYHHGENKVWQVLKVPSVDAEDQPHLHRDLETLKLSLDKKRPHQC